MAVELRLVTEPVDIPCPYCGAELLRIERHDGYMLGKAPWAEDSDTVPIYDLVPSDALERYCVLLAGTPACCGKSYIAVTATLASGDPDEEARGRYFYGTEAPEKQTNFIARSTTHRWIVQRFESKLGPVLQHTFGPFAWEDRSWIGPHGVSSCHTDNRGNPFGFARELLANHWRDLEALSIEAGAVRPIRPARGPNNKPDPPEDDEIPF